MDFSVWGILQKRECKKKHHSVESLKRDFLKEWEKLPQDMFHATYENAIKKKRELFGIPMKDILNNFMHLVSKLI